PVAQEDEIRPQFDLEGTAERPALAVLDLDVAHRRVAREQFAQVRLQRLAMRAPVGTEFHDDRSRQAVDRLARRLGTGEGGFHFRLSLSNVDPSLSERRASAFPGRENSFRIPIPFGLLLVSEPGPVIFPDGRTV